MGSDPSGQTNEYKIDICCFSTKHPAWSESKDWLAWDHDNVYEWSDMSEGYPTQCVGLLVQSQHHLIPCNLFSARYCSFGIKQKSLTYLIIKDFTHLTRSYSRHIHGVMVTSSAIHHRVHSSLGSK